MNVSQSWKLKKSSLFCLDFESIIKSSKKKSENAAQKSEKLEKIAILHHKRTYLPTCWIPCRITFQDVGC